MSRIRTSLFFALVCAAAVPACKNASPSSSSSSQPTASTRGEGGSGFTDDSGGTGRRYVPNRRVAPPPRDPA
ncbi:MAG: hypothetical protein KC464_07900, partial [Myxococcales bacterium]|nr:hypothetical protein [Myxococcales bacterium]